MERRWRKNPSGGVPGKALDEVVVGGGEMEKKIMENGDLLLLVVQGVGERCIHVLHLCGSFYIALMACGARYFILGSLPSYDRIFRKLRIFFGDFQICFLF